MMFYKFHGMLWIIPKHFCMQRNWFFDWIGAWYGPFKTRTDNVRTVSPHPTLCAGTRGPAKVSPGREDTQLFLHSTLTANLTGEFPKCRGRKKNKTDLIVSTAHTHAWTHACTQAHTQTHTHTHTYTHTHMHTHTHTDIHTHNGLDLRTAVQVCLFIIKNLLSPIRLTFVSLQVSWGQLQGMIQYIKNVIQVIIRHFQSAFSDAVWMCPHFKSKASLPCSLLTTRGMKTSPFVLEMSQFEPFHSL